MILTIFIFIVVLGLLVFVHELGHFIAARKSGMQVEEFGFGFPPRVVGVQKLDGKWRWVWGHKVPKTQTSQSPATPTPAAEDKIDAQTIYSINLIPLGGFVRILGENNEHADNPRSFINRPFGGRFITLVAGVLMNVLLAWALISAGFIAGLPTGVVSESDVPKHAKLVDPAPTIIDVAKNSPAAAGGLKPNDILVSLNGQTFVDLADIQTYIKQNAGQIFNFVVKRKSEVLNLQVHSLSQPAPDQGPTGIILANVGRLKYPWYFAFWEGLKTVSGQIAAIFSGLYHLFASKAGLESLGGPVKIAQLTGQVADMGFIFLLQFTAFLSVNLAVLNILPFPALDGGRLLFLIIEKIRGKRNNQRIEQFVNTAGFVFLLLLMILVTFKDIFGKS